MNAKLLLPAILAALALGLVYALTKPAPPAVSQQTTAVMLPPVPSPAAIENLQPVSPPAQVNVLYAQPNVFDIVVKGGRRLSSEEAVQQVHQGEEVTLRITSDKADELHLHGYNLSMPVWPERTAVITFKADRTGRFTYELHKSGLELGALEVYPR